MTSQLGAGPSGPVAVEAALARLPLAGLWVPELDADPAWRLAAAFLLG